MFGSLDELFIFFHLRWFIITWVDLFVLAKVCSLILLPTIIKLFSPLLFKISWQPNELAISNPLIHMQLNILLIHRLPFLCQAKHLDSVLNQLSLYFLVKTSSLFLKKNFVNQYRAIRSITKKVIPKIFGNFEIT